MVATDRHLVFALGSMASRVTFRSLRYSPQIRRTENVIDLLQTHQAEISAICGRLQIRRLDVFGSAATGSFDPSRSDVDFIVEFDEPEAEPGLLARYLALAGELEALLGLDVELITPQSIRNPYFRQSIEASREPIYAA